MSALNIKVGQTVKTTGHQEGVVRYVGAIHVSEGTFIGIELPTPDGKNDGSVRGERYFTCAPGHGLFIRDTSIATIISEATPTPPTPTPRAVSRARAPTTTPRARPSSVVAPKPTAARTTTLSKRQSVAAPSASQPPSRGPVRKASVASTSSNSAAESSRAQFSRPESSRAEPTRPESSRPESSRPAPSTSRPSLGSSVTSNAGKAPRDGHVESLQTTIRHMEKQHAEDQERLREFAQVRDEKDRFSGLIQRLQTKCQSQYTEIQEHKEKLKTLQSELEALNKSLQDHEVDLEDALVDKEMAEERADQAEAEIESLRKRLEEQTLELDILRDEAELFTTEMSEEQKQEAGYYRLQHENDRLREALITLKEMTEEREQDFKARILGLEGDISQLEFYERENGTLHERLNASENLVDHLKQQLDAANEWEDMVEELTQQNQNLQDRIAEQDMVVQDLENLRELNDELEAQHLEQEEDMLAELEAKNNELAEQARQIAEQTAIITDHESLISKFRDLVMDLQARMADAESSKSMTEAQVKDTTGRFNEVMDLNRQLRAATVLSTTREIEASLISLKADQLAERLEIWNETESKEFTRSESLQAYLTTERIAGKSDLLISVLRSTNRHMSNGGRLDDAVSRLVCVQSIVYLEVLKDGSNRLWSAVRGLSLSDFANIGPTYQELITVEQVLDQGLNALKADTINFEEFTGSLERSTKTLEAILSSHQDVLAGRPEGEMLSLFVSIHARLEHIAYMYDLATFVLQKVPDTILHECEYTLEHFNTPLDNTQAALTAAAKLLRTVQALAQDHMYPQFPYGLDDAVKYDEALASAAGGIARFVRGLIEEVAKCTSLSDNDSASAREIAEIKYKIDDLDNDQCIAFYTAGLNGLTAHLHDWSDRAGLLANTKEIEHGPTPWAQKAKEVEASRKKDDEAIRQLQSLTAEHRATVLKIHEREQVIATKELEIEHLLAKIKDATSKTEGLEALQEELERRHDKIMELQALDRTQMLEIESLRERLANADEPSRHDVELTMENTTAPVEQPREEEDPLNVPGRTKTMFDALVNENHWLRKRENSVAFGCNLMELFAKMEMDRSSAMRKESTAKTNAIFEQAFYERACLTDDDSESVESSSETSSRVLEQEDLTYHIQNTQGSGRPKMSAVELTGISLGWEQLAHSHKVALEQAEEDFMHMSTLDLDDEDYEDLSFVAAHI
ncbi:dynein associated protein-domain-containing protein [Alternaria alternata]|nr:dynein associated protein-domain-containing protein [Alternaria alternata]